MRMIKNGRKRRLYMSAAERRAVHSATSYIRCPSCHAIRLAFTGVRGGMNCQRCGWYGSFAKDIEVSFSYQSTYRCARVVRVEQVICSDGTMLYRRPRPFSATPTE